MPASSLSANKSFLNKFARMNSTVKLLTRGGRGDARLFLERDQKRDQAKSKALEISSAKFFRPPSTRKINLEFFTRVSPLVVPKMVDFAPQRNARYTSGFPFSTLLSFFYPYLKGLFTWSGGPRSSGVGFFCFHALGDTKQKETYPTRPGSPTPCK